MFIQERRRFLTVERIPMPSQGQEECLAGRRCRFLGAGSNILNVPLASCGPACEPWERLP